MKNIDVASKINALMREKVVTQKHLAELIDMSVPGLQKALQTNDFKISVLLKISKVFSVPLSYFFLNDNDFSDYDVSNYIELFKSLVIYDVSLIDGFCRMIIDNRNPDIHSLWVFDAVMHKYKILTENQFQFLIRNDVMRNETYEKIKFIIANNKYPPASVE